MKAPDQKPSFNTHLLGFAGAISSLSLAILIPGCATSAGSFSSTTAAASSAPPAASGVTPTATPLIVHGPSVLTIDSSGTYIVAAPLAAGTIIQWSLMSSNPTSSTGTISSSGMYQAPALVPNPSVVTIVASTNSPLYSSGMLPVTVSQPTPTITSATAVSSPIGSTYLLDVHSTGLGPSPVLLVNGNRVTTTQVSTGDLQATLTTPAQPQLSVEVENTGSGGTISSSDPVAITPTTPSVTAASRLIDQATFGPTDALITQVQQSGFNAFLNQQFATPATLIPAFSSVNPSYCGDLSSCIRYSWWGVALYGNDQLRQRVAFALSEMWVVSAQEVSPYGMPQYLNTLSNDAFSNWYTLMKDVTLTPAMGSYLNMVNSFKPAGGAIANQNFAREMMQLFSIGTNSLNLDGTPMLDSFGKTIPNYTQAQVDGFARAYTGWTYPNLSGTPIVGANWTPTFNAAMVSLPNYHDTNAKPLMNGVTLPAGQSPEQDLEGALQNIFHHPSLPPFVCKQLIQHLVTSNPSPAYISRVASVFINDGQGVRGNMQAVISAILLDPEARAGDTGAVDPNFGHLREPILWVASSFRGLGATTAKADLTTFIAADVAAISLGQQPQSSPSVFNFFAPSYQLPGATTFAPEFQLEQTASAISRMNVGNDIVFSDWSGYFTIDFAGYWASLTIPDPNALLDQLSRIFLHGQMSADMRNSILTAISSTTIPKEKVRIAAYLVITSPQYKISH